MFKNLFAYISACYTIYLNVLLCLNKRNTLHLLEFGGDFQALVEVLEKFGRGVALDLLEVQGSHRGGRGHSAWEEYAGHTI